MFLHVISTEYIKDYKILISFNNGIEGIVNLENELYGEVFEPLKDINSFKKFKLDPEIDTIVWDNGADFSPEFLLEKLEN